MTKNIKIRVLCLIIAGIMLTGSLLVAAVNGSPYETLKNAIFDAMTYESFTMQGQMQVVFNGEIEEFDKVHLIVGENSSLEYSFRDGEPTGFSYTTESLRVSSNAFTSRDGTQWYSAWVFANSPHINHTNSFGVSPEERNSARFRFMELLLDLAVGDLKNHMTMSTSGGVRSVTGTITHNQLPEIVRVRLDVIIEESQRWYRGDFGSPEDFRNPLDIPMQSIVFNRIHGDADIDSDGNLLHISGYVDLAVTNVFSEVSSIEFMFELDFSDIGTSNPQSPVPGAAELFTREFIEENFGARHSLMVYFTRNADGSINEDSITTTWPGQRN